MTEKREEERLNRTTILPVIRLLPLVLVLDEAIKKRVAGTDKLPKQGDAYLPHQSDKATERWAPHRSEEKLPWEG